MSTSRARLVVVAVESEPMRAPDPSPTTTQLPRGKHRLTREQVVMSQRNRMFTAMADAVAEKGYANVSVADVIQRAGVSRLTFYEHFSNKLACFLAAYEMGTQLMVDAMTRALGPDTDDPVERLSRALEAYLETLAAEPAIACTALVEIYAAGPDAVAQRVQQQRLFVDTVVTVLGARSSRARFACEAFVNAVSSMVTVRVANGDFEGLRALHAPLLDLVRCGMDQHQGLNSRLTSGQNPRP
jgi:AcrR family transcriptional regulator